MHGSHFSDLQPLENDSAVRGLELFRNDLPANAPELFRDDVLGNAPELDHGQWAPQVVADRPDAIALEDTAIDDSDTKVPRRYTCGVSRKVCWALAACISTAAVTIAVGVGVGFGVMKHSSDLPSTPTTSPSSTPTSNSPLGPVISPPSTTGSFVYGCCMCGDTD